MARFGAQHCTRPTAEDVAAREVEGRALRVERERLGLGRREVAAELGIHGDVLRRWEDGSSPIPAPRREQLRALYQRRAAA